VLQDAGLKVAPVDGWEDGGVGDVRTTVGVICHHTAGPKNGNMLSLNTFLEGRSDLPGLSLNLASVAMAPSMSLLLEGAITQAKAVGRA
jgi:hypothetical protein